MDTIIIFPSLIFTIPCHLHRHRAKINNCKRRKEEENFKTTTRMPWNEKRNHYFILLLLLFLGNVGNVGRVLSAAAATMTTMNQQVAFELELIKELSSGAENSSFLVFRGQLSGDNANNNTSPQREQQEESTGRYYFHTDRRFTVFSTDLWVTDLTPNGTKVALDTQALCPNDDLSLFSPDSPGPFEISYHVGGWLYYICNSGFLWQTNGIETETKPVIEYNETWDYGSSKTVQVGEKLFFWRVINTDPASGWNSYDDEIELWEIDENNEKRSMNVRDVLGGNAFSLGSLMPGNGGVFFRWVRRDNDNDQLWFSDGTVQGTRHISNISENFEELKSYFNAMLHDGRFVIGTTNFYYDEMVENGIQTQLWVSDGTDQGTELILTGGLPPESPNFTPLPGRNQTIFWWLEGSTQGINATIHLYVTDGTMAGTKSIYNETVAGGDFISRVLSVSNGPGYNFLNSAKFYQISEGKALILGIENIWVTDGTEAGTYVLKNFRKVPQSIDLPIVGFDNVLVNDPFYMVLRYEPLDEILVLFLYDLYEDGTERNEIWISDGTSSGTKMIQALTYDNGCIPISASRLYIGEEKWLVNCYHPDVGAELGILNLSSVEVLEGIANGTLESPSPSEIVTSVMPSSSPQASPSTMPSYYPDPLTVTPTAIPSSTPSLLTAIPSVSSSAMSFSHVRPIASICVIVIAAASFL